MDPAGDAIAVEGGNAQQGAGPNAEQAAHVEPGAAEGGDASPQEPGHEVRDSKGYVCLSVDCAASGHVNCQENRDTQAEEQAQEPDEDSEDVTVLIPPPEKK